MVNNEKILTSLNECLLILLHLVYEVCWVCVGGVDENEK